MLEVLLERLQEELLVFGVRVARVVDVVVRGVDTGRRELHPVLKRRTIIRWSWPYCYSNTGAKHGDIAFWRPMRVSRFRGFGTVAEEQTIGGPLSRNPFSNAIGDLKISCFLSPRVSWAGSECRLCW